MPRLITILLSLLWLCFAPQLQAQKMSKFYISKQTEQGVLYFVLRQKMPKLSGDGGKKLFYDFTYLQDYDYSHLFTGEQKLVTLLFTVEQASATPIVSFSLGQGGVAHPCETLNTIYKGKKWVSRVRCKLPYDSWRQSMLSPEPVAFVLRTEAGQYASYALKAKKWDKLRRAYSVFFDLLNMNIKVA